MSEENIQPTELEVDAAAPASIEVEPTPVEVAPEPEPVVVAVPEPTPELQPIVEPEPAVAVEVVEQPKVNKPKASSRHVVSSGEKDSVFLSNCVYKNKFARKSLTVHHVQRRLVELGYNEAYADRDGWLGDLTKLAIIKFQVDKGLNATGNVDADTFTKLFEGDNNVEINLN